MKNLTDTDIAYIVLAVVLLLSSLGLAVFDACRHSGVDGEITPVYSDE